MGFKQKAARLMLSGAVKLMGANLPAFDAAASGGVRLGGWTPSTEFVNSIMGGQGDLLRSRSRDMARNNPFVSQTLDRYVSNAIGTGIRPQSRHPDAGKRKEIHESFNRWADESDAYGVTNYYGQQAMAVRSMVEGGDCFGRFRARRPGDGLSVPLQIELLESEMVPLAETRDLGNGRRVRGGVEFDAVGRRTAFHMLPQHPGDVNFSGGGFQARRILAENVTHIYRPLRPGQVRGVVGMASALLSLYELDQYQDAEMVRQKISSMITGWITQGVGEDGTPLNSNEDKAGDDAVEIARLVAGTFQVLGPGEGVEISQTPDIGAGVNDFVKGMLRRAAAGSPITYEQLTGDLSDVNYSSIRAGLLEFRRECEQFQHCFLIYQFCRPVWRRFMTDAILAGTISAPDFKQNPHHYLDASWTPHGFKWVDPQKEVQALLKAIRAGLISRSEAIRLSGYNPELVDQELAEDKARAHGLGLVLDSDPEQVSAAGLTQARPPNSELPDGDESQFDDDTDATAAQSYLSDVG